MTSRSTIAAAAAITALALSAAPASAAPTTYTFTTNAGAMSGISPVTALLGSAPTVSGTFKYDATAPLWAQSQDVGYASGLSIYAGIPGVVGAFYALSGTVGGLSFSDVSGTVSVGNEYPTTGGDYLTLSSDPSPRPGQTATPSDLPRQLVGFSVGAYTLNNVRLFWMEGVPGTPDFLSSNAMPATPPTSHGRLSLDFVLTSDLRNTSGGPYYARTVTFDGLTVSAAPTTAVPEPESWVMALAGLGLLATWRKSRSASRAA